MHWHYELFLHKSPFTGKVTTVLHLQCTILRCNNIIIQLATMMTMISRWLSISSALLMVSLVDGGKVQFNPVGDLFQGFIPSAHKVSNSTLRDLNEPTREQRQEEREARRQRQRERKERVKEAMKYMKPDKAEQLSKEDLESLSEEHPALRELWGSGETVEYADPGEDYDMWQQAFRMLGGFIDCDHNKDEGGSHDNGDGDGGDNDGACSRWMMWASYIDPNYQGNGYDEYFGDNPTGVLDCHHPNTEWVLLGVYRQEFYQFIEQISKHLWAIDEYEYVVALAGLAYMTDDDCFYVGTANDGSYIYAGVAPQEYGEFKMALYTDDYCLYPNENLGMTFDDFGLYSDVKLSSQDNGDDDSYSYAQEWWQDSQEYTLTLLNEVYDEYRYCTSCIDYPTYQDGYFIGDYGTDDDDLINQCWKFYSHDSFPCESDCIALGHAQGTILSIVVGDRMYGQALDYYYDTTNSDAAANAKSSYYRMESPVSRFLANAFVTFSFIVFVSTFLAFAVARRSRYRESRGSKSRRLLDDGKRSKRSGRSTSRRRGEDGDGVYRSSRKSRSGSRKDRKKSSRSRSNPKSDEGNYEPPKRRTSNSRRSTSRDRKSEF